MPPVESTEEEPVGDSSHPLWRTIRGEVPPPPCAQTLGWTPVEVEPGTGRVVVDFQATPEFCNPLGNVQGGFLGAMLDDAIGPAVSTMLGDGEFCTTLELKVSFIRPTRPGRLRAIANVVHRGRTIAFAEAEIRDADDELVARATSTLRLIRLDADQLLSADAPARPA
jgi:uncharacterized protein (TIGR00369 family)